jgi:hypothetical protein
MTDKRLVVTGIVALVFTVPVLVQPQRNGNLHRRGVCVICSGADRVRPVQRLTNPTPRI